MAARPILRRNKKKRTMQRMSKAQLETFDRRVLQFVRTFQLKEGNSPTRAEIMEALKLPHLMAAQRALDRLQENGLLEVEKNAARGISVAGTDTSSNEIAVLPLLGVVAAGQPIEAIENASTIQVPLSLIRGNARHFVLRVRGDSMIEDHICDGDLVIVREQETAINGDRVIALIDNEATLKRFYKRQGRIELHPANENMSPIIVQAHQHLRIAGVYVGLIRNQT